MLDAQFRIVDVFTERPFEGNSLAVFPRAEALDGPTMQAIARELNFSETTFVLPPALHGCAARVRIFTPKKEMEFAGHPTIGSAFVLLDEPSFAGQLGDTFALEEKCGLVPVRVERGAPAVIWLQTPSIVCTDTFDRVACASALRLDLHDLLDLEPKLLSAGNPCVMVPLKHPEAVDRAALDADRWARLKGSKYGPMCVVIFAQTERGAYARMFAPDYGITEDPATGSAAGPLVSYMIDHHLIARQPQRLLIEQGVAMGRRSALHVLVSQDSETMRFEVGGSVSEVARGTLNARLP